MKNLNLARFLPTSGINNQLCPVSMESFPFSHAASIVLGICKIKANSAPLAGRKAWLAPAFSRPRLAAMVPLFLAALGIWLFHASSDALAQEWTEPTPEELDAQFGLEEYAAMQARYSHGSKMIARKTTPSSLILNSDLVFTGVVKDIFYTYEGSNENPYTNIIFEIDSVLKGSYTNRDIAIKQFGGPEKEGPIVAIESQAEFFNVGEHELIFLEFSGEDLRIVNRFRIHENRLYNADGFGLIMMRDGGLNLSRVRNPANRFREIRIGKHVLYKTFSESTSSQMLADRMKGIEQAGSYSSPDESETIVTLKQFFSAISY